MFGGSGTTEAAHPGGGRRSSLRWPGQRADHGRLDGDPASSDAGAHPASPPRPPVADDATRDKDRAASAQNATEKGAPGGTAPTPPREHIRATAKQDSYRERLRRTLSRSRGRQRKSPGRGRQDDVAARSPPPRSSSLGTKLGMSLRSAVMGKTLLGVHRPAGGRNPSAVSRGSCEEEADGESSGSDEEAGSGEQHQEGAGRRRLHGHHCPEDERRKHRAREERNKEHECSSGELDDGTLSLDSPLAPPSCSGDPRNLPEAVASYIGARARMEKEMGASGPTLPFRAPPGVPSPSAVPRMMSGGKRRGSLDITNDAPCGPQSSRRRLPFTEALFKAGVSETLHSTKQGILLEGDLQKFSPESLRGVRWHKRYFVLYAGACELRYYRSHADAAWGRIPLGERGSIPLRLVVKIRQPSDNRYHGCRFDLVVLHRGEGRHPGLHIRPGRERRVLTTKTFKLNAPSAQQRLLWVTIIEALMKNHGWGYPHERPRRIRPPEHGGGFDVVANKSGEQAVGAVAGAWATARGEAEGSGVE